MVGRRGWGRGKGEAEREAITILQAGDNKDLKFTSRNGEEEMG